MSKNIRVGISHGDYNGIGYEVIFKTFADDMMFELCTPVVFGSRIAAEEWKRMLGEAAPDFVVTDSPSGCGAGKLNVVDVCGDIPAVTPGVPTPESGKAAVCALVAAVDALRCGEIDVLVTAPICKDNVQSDEFHFPGHTEFLQSVAGDGAKAVMILFNDDLRVALVTTHLPICEVAHAITRERVVETIKGLDSSLRRDFAFERPKIAVLSLNPHSGDNGLLGTEEQSVISPAIAEAVADNMLVFGPFAADGFFGSGSYRHYDGVVAMYHDQGLAPFKTIAGTGGVNFTAGLPFVRTSPDHGTAFGIAGKGEADETSMRQAVYDAIDIARRRRVFDRASANPLRRHFVEKGADKTVDLTKDKVE